MKLRKNLLMLPLLMLAGKPAAAQENFAFQSGENVQYTVFFNLGFISVKAAQANMTANECVYQGEKAWDVQIAAKTIKMFKTFNVRDTIRTKANYRTLVPYLSEQQTHEDDYYSSIRIDFNYEGENGFEAHVRKTKKSGVRDTLITAQKAYYDVITTIYNLRNFDDANLVQDKEMPMPVILSRDLYDLNWKFVGRERVKLKNGNVYNCLKIKPNMVGGTLFTKGDAMTIWITDDKNHIPVMIEAKLKHGGIKAYADNIRNNKYPLSSLVSTKK